VLNPTFEWLPLSAETLSLKCSAYDIAYISLEIESEDSYDATIGPQTSLSASPLTTKKLIIKRELLSLSTRYFWRLSIIYQPSNGTSISESTIYSSSVQTFSTVSKHCSYINCNNGDCNSSTLSCDCHSDYRGEFCDITGLTSGAIAGILIGVTFFTIFILFIIFFLLKRRYFTGLQIPDMSLYMFTLPKSNNESILNS